MQYADLATHASNEGLSNQQADLDTFLSLLRPLSGQGARYLTAANAVMLDAANYASAIVASLDAGATIPNKTGLSGAQALTKEDVQTLITQLEALLTTYATTANQQLQAKACGAVNMIG